MPVKVRCECGAGISAPDAARGKTIKCKQCGSPVRVPGRKKKAAKKKRAEPTPFDQHDEDFFSNIDMGRVEDMNVQVCPKCATEVDEEDIECPGCGINLETGELSKKQKSLRKYKGPNPDDFYKESWGNSFRFLKANMGIAIGLCLFYAISWTLYTGSLFMSLYCDRKPLIVFWSCLTFVCGAAPIGAIWQLWIETIKATRDEKEVLKRFKFDFFSCVTLGIKAYIWPIALNLPVLLPALWLVGLAGALGSQTALIGASALLLFALGAVYVIPMMCYPVAMSHMASKYAFRAYLPHQMFRVTFQNFGPVAWWFLMVFALQLITLAVGVLSAIYFVEITDYFSDSILKLVEAVGVSIEESERGFMFSMTLAGIAMAILFIVQLVAAVFTCIPAVIMMRANGLLAYYNGRTLELGFKVEGLEPAGFWVRYLAFLIDLCVIGAFYVLSACGMYMVNWAAHAAEMESVDRVKDAIFYAQFIALAGIPFLYFLTEAGPSSCTLGMRSLGLMVVQKGRPRVQFQATIVRSLLRTMIIVFSLGIPLIAIALIQAAWSKEKQTMHDVATKTNVVWRPENL